MHATPPMTAAAAPPATAAPNVPPPADAITGLAARDRVRGFDLARGLAVLFMIGVHVLFHWGAPETWTTPIGQAISFLGGPTAAPVFMFLMGASLAFSSRSSFGSLVVRGLWLVWLGYLLNVLRGVIPAYVGLETGVVTAEQIAPFTLPWLLTTVDVHHMAGLSLVAIALLWLVVKPSWPWLVVAAAVVLVAPLLRGVTFGTPLLDGPLTPVLSDAPNVYYAVLPWIAYPLVGGVFGSIMARASDRTRVFRLGAVLGLGLCAAGVALFLIDPPTFDIDTYWDEPPSFVVGILGLVLLWLAACDFVVRHVPANRFFTFLYGWSGAVIAIYFTHWLVVGWGIGIAGFRSLGLEAALLGIVIAIAVTHFLSRFAVGLETPRWLDRWSGRAARQLAPTAHGDGSTAAPAPKLDTPRSAPTAAPRN
jgi:uncharacterized membrane protein